MAKSTIVLGTAMGYGPEPVRVFVESLRRHYDGEIGLLVTSRGPAALLDYLARWDVTPIFFDTALWMVTDVQVGRYVRYYEFLRGRPDAFERVLLSDVSDVLFQGHPFADCPQGELLLFLEDRRHTIGTNKSNALWINDVFGPEVLGSISDRPISCSGTTIGTQAAMERYIELMLKHAKPPLMQSLQGKRGHDQGIHNYLLHTGALEPLGGTVIGNGAFIHTLALVPPGEVVVAEDGIATLDGRRCPIVHQYNYHPQALAWVKRAWP